MRTRPKVKPTVTHGFFQCNRAWKFSTSKSYPVPKSRYVVWSYVPGPFDNNLRCTTIATLDDTGGYCNVQNLHWYER